MDRSQFTTARSLVGLLATPKNKLIVTGQPGEIREFIAVALTDGVPLSKELYLRYAKDPNSLASVSAGSTRYVLKAKIVADARGATLGIGTNPHHFLLDPCKLGSAADVNTTMRVVKLYTTYVSGANFNQSGGNQIRTGDKIRVAMVFNRYGKLSLEQGEILSLVFTSENNSLLADECINLSGVFESALVLGTPDTSGAADYTSLDPDICDEADPGVYLIHPLQSTAKITSDQGWRIHPQSKIRQYHAVTDIRARTTLPLYAAADGVVSTSYLSGGGNALTIDHGTHDGKNYKPVSMHLQKFAVAAGTSV